MPKPLVSIPEAKRSSNDDIIFTINKLTDILAERSMNDPAYDEGTILRGVLGDKMMDNPDGIKVPVQITESIIAIPSVLPRKNADGSKKPGSHVVPVIQVPGSEPYYAWLEGSETFLSSETVVLRTPRSVSLHKVIPGMIVSFHHYRVEGGEQTRHRIDVIKIGYHKDGTLAYEKLAESDMLIHMPDPNAGFSTEF